MSKPHNLIKLLGLLQRGPSKTAVILKELGVSQPTFSRLWVDVRHGVALGASKARLYALRRLVQGVHAPIPVFLVSDVGLPEPIGYLDVLQGEFYAMPPT